MQKQQLQEELKQAMLNRNDLKKSVLRMVLSAIGYYEIQKGGAGYTASEEDVMAVLQKEVKQHKDSIEQFKNAGRQELVDKEEKELAILQAYLPSQMSREELQPLVEEALAKTGVTSLQEIGKVMGVLMPQVKGKADGTLVQSLVRAKLS